MLCRLSTQCLLGTPIPGGLNISFSPQWVGRSDKFTYSVFLTGLFFVAPGRLLAPWDVPGLPSDIHAFPPFAPAVSFYSRDKIKELIHNYKILSHPCPVIGIIVATRIGYYQGHGHPPLHFFVQKMMHACMLRSVFLGSLAAGHFLLKLRGQRRGLELSVSATGTIGVHFGDEYL